MDLFAQAWWTRERPRARVAAMLDSSPANAGLLVEGELVAFARAISDFEFKAVIVDVIVDASLRRAGLGRRVVSTLLNHPALGRVDDFELYCDPELVGYYAQLGFAQPAGTQFMRLSRT
ncbi:GNAT family N-acetyltransferase [Angustibacter sp. Root456]|uniref:GNAT family N-acetyltransferase n=1 Tax=Angustibacter sp. Root456 TaxID=1736539 RepID=UPI002101A4A0|nr:GNAT family N-acetyltransferase [Angustibacter sp. Root456]